MASQADSAETDSAETGSAEADGARRPVRTSVWLEGKPAARGRRGAADEGRASERPQAHTTTGLDRERITATTVRMLDADGPEKFSMRRLAAELSVTAMSLYWYVDTKDDLLELALDEVFGEVRSPDLTDDEADWRDQLRELATSYRAVLVRHPWVSPLIGKYLNIGPHSMAFSAAVQAVMNRTGLAPGNRMSGLAAVFQFVYGFGTIEGHFVQRCSDAGLSQDEYFRLAMGTVREQPEYHGTFENADKLMAARGGDTVEEMRDRDFTFALELIITGIETMRDRDASRD
ncbi:TetR/AcrR family transcriptional regulator [Streptomyces sp. NRRL F-5135]|uniref:TetR/AcrR family transcriptional regulator n=1 Tax=Streptomyces sp. NRRL F-5135 TaxID=1463858 RepID=UPI00068C1BAE|nr:TetR/AcrR family transcriptional regulator [Streptomyces sp. NRRL F-5135]